MSPALGLEVPGSPVQDLLAGGPQQVKAEAAGRSSSSWMLEEAAWGTALRRRLDPYAEWENRVFLGSLYNLERLALWGVQLKRKIN